VPNGMRLNVKNNSDEQRPSCAACNSSGKVLIDFQEAQKMRAVIIQTYSDSALCKCPHCSKEQLRPAINYLSRLDRYPHQAAAITSAEEIALSDYPAGWLVLSGNYGSGKTTIAEAMIRTLASRGLHTETLTVPGIRQQIYSSFRTRTTEELVLSLKRMRVLLIDEMDAAKWSDSELEELLSEVLNARYQAANSKLTILCGAHFNTVPGRIRSRMSEFGIFDLGEIDLRAPTGSPWDRGE
jgi:ABC-type glutathione transport system ATPase component